MQHGVTDRAVVSTQNGPPPHHDSFAPCSEVWDGCSHHVTQFSLGRVGPLLVSRSKKRVQHVDFPPLGPN
eukprot:7271801-Pyramimonas_sp.AAC.1